MDNNYYTYASGGTQKDNIMVNSNRPKFHNKKRTIIILIVSLIIILGATYFFIPKKAGNICGFCAGPPYIVKTENSCIGFRYEKQPPKECNDCGVTLMCVGVVTPWKKCYTYSENNGVKINFAEVPNCKNPETWQEALNICPVCYNEAAKLAYNADDLNKAIEICTSINDSDEKNNCYIELASLKKDSYVCDQISDSTLKNNCFLSLGIKLPIKLDLFVMSQCIYAPALESIMPNLENIWKDKINIELHHLIYSNINTGYPKYCIDSANKYCDPLGGAAQVRQSIVELCIQKYQRDKLWNFVNDANSYVFSGKTMPTWSVIAQPLGIDVDKIKSCQQQEWRQLLEAEKQGLKTSYQVIDPSKHNGTKSILIVIDSSPTLVINGMFYDGNRNQYDVMKSICSSFENPPKECKQFDELPIPDDAKDARIKSTLWQIMDIAKMQYIKENSFVNVCNGTALGTSTELTIAAQEIQKNGGNIICYSAASGYCIYSTLKSDPNKSFCIDSTGVSMDYSASIGGCTGIGSPAVLTCAKHKN